MFIFFSNFYPEFSVLNCLFIGTSKQIWPKVTSRHFSTAGCKCLIKCLCILQRMSTPLHSFPFPPASYSACRPLPKSSCLWKAWAHTCCRQRGTFSLPFLEFAVNMCTTAASLHSEYSQDNAMLSGFSRSSSHLVSQPALFPVWLPPFPNTA